MRPVLAAALLATGVAIGTAHPCAAQGMSEGMSEGRGDGGGEHGAAIESVANIDIMPGEQAAARLALDAYLAGARADPGVASVGLVLQDGTTNHFMLMQRFASRVAFDAHLRRPYVRAFRSALFPHLGSPYDERVGTDAGG